MPLILMRALTSLTRQGRRVRPGHLFQTSPIEAAALRYGHQADFATAADAAPRPVVETSSVAEVPAEERDGQDPPKSRRRYKRADLTAEE
jgi:hypothetical protein